MDGRSFSTLGIVHVAESSRTAAFMKLSTDIFGCWNFIETGALTNFFSPNDTREGGM